MRITFYSTALKAATASALLSGMLQAQAIPPVPTPARGPGSVQRTTAPPPAAAAGTHGSAASSGTVTTATASELASKTPSPEGVLVDQVVGVVNGDLILESDVDAERRFEAFEPFRGSDVFSRDRAIERLTDRALILQQASLQPDQIITLDEAKAQLKSVRKELPGCRKFDCDTDAGWASFVKDEGFTASELDELWRQRMQTLKFVEMRFRSGIQITPAEIKTYYEKTLLPQYAARHATAPKLEVISDRIQEILLQEQVSNLLGDWLQSLKAQGTVRMMRPGEVEP